MNNWQTVCLLRDIYQQRPENDQTSIWRVNLSIWDLWDL